MAACNNNTVPGCLPPPPINNTVITVEVSTTPLGVPMHPLAPAVTLDGWNGTLFPKWGNGSYLALDLRSPDLLRYASALAPAILRLGGSPEDSIEFTLDGSGCVPGSGGNGPAPGGYYCSQVHPYHYGCLTGARWEELLTFANTTGLSIVLGVNGCSGRMSRDTPMDFSNIKALLTATAASPHRGSLIGLELSNEVFNNTISPAAWGKDMDTLKGVVMATLGGPLAVMAGPDDASPTHLSQALNSTQKGTLTAMTYHHYPGCEANTSDYFVLEPLCLQIIDDWGVQFSNAAGAPAGIATWAGETAGHGGGGVANLTDSFTSSLYYAWQLGVLPLTGVELSARQALVGGDYELLSRDTWEPNPDYWLLWLFKGLLVQGWGWRRGGGGSGGAPTQRVHAYPISPSLSVELTGVRVFAFGGDPSIPGGGPRVIMALSLNRVGATLGVEVVKGLLLPGDGVRRWDNRTEYHLTGSLGVGGGRVRCNGIELGVDGAGEMPDWRVLGVKGPAGGVMWLAPSSIAFAVVP